MIGYFDNLTLLTWLKQACDRRSYGRVERLPGPAGNPLIAPGSYILRRRGQHVVIKGVGAAGGFCKPGPPKVALAGGCQQRVGRASQALLRQRDLELEERGKLLYKTKARLQRRRALPGKLLRAAWQTGSALRTQVAIEQLQQELTTTKQEVEVVKGEARQARGTLGHKRGSEVARWVS